MHLLPYNFLGRLSILKFAPELLLLLLVMEMASHTPGESYPLV